MTPTRKKLCELVRSPYGPLIRIYFAKMRGEKLL
jgi:hypothetical protein